MARGGPRPGAGRPRGTRSTLIDIPGEAAAVEMSPLDYMLSVMRDPEADSARRDRMAQAAAPYVHPKAGEAKKPDAAEVAANAHKGTGWDSVLPN